MVRKAYFKAKCCVVVLGCLTTIKTAQIMVIPVLSSDQIEAKLSDQKSSWARSPRGELRPLTWPGNDSSHARETTALLALRSAADHDASGHLMPDPGICLPLRRRE